MSQDQPHDERTIPRALIRPIRARACLAEAVVPVAAVHRQRMCTADDTGKWMSAHDVSSMWRLPLD